MAVTKLISSVSQNAHTCIQCGKIFRSIVKYIIHKSRHESHITFITNIRKKYLSNHKYRFCWKRYHVCNFYRKAYNCAMCQKSFINEKTVVNHLKNCPFNSDHKCLFCDYTSSSQSDIINHSKQHTDEQPYECTKCKKKFVSLGELTDHEQVHLSPKYLCFTCGMVFADKNILKNHLEAHRGKYLCAHCGREYSGRDYFYHTEVIELSPCKECGLSLQYLCMYEKHKKMHGETVERSKNRTKKLCEQCGKEYSGKDYIFHEELDDDLSPCKICGLRFDYICVYEKHVKEHMEALENIKTCKTKADLCQYIECAEVALSQDPMVYGYHHVCMLCGKRYKELQSTLIHMEMHLRTELGVNENEASPINCLEPMDTLQGIDRNWDSNFSSGLETAFDAVMKRNSGIDSDLQFSHKPKKGTGLKLPRIDSSVGRSTKGLPRSSANIHVEGNGNGNPFKVKTRKIIVVQNSVSPNKNSRVTNKDIGITAEYRAIFSDISKKNKEDKKSKIEPPIAEFLGFEKVCPKDAANNKRSSIIKSQNDSNRKCVSDNGMQSNLILAPDKECKSINSEEGDILCVMETEKLNKTPSNLQEHKYAENDKDEIKGVSDFHGGLGDNSELVQVFKSLEPIVNNMTIRDFNLGDIQVDKESEVIGQHESGKNIIKFPLKDGKVEEEFITEEALVDDTFSAVSLEESLSGTMNPSSTTSDDTNENLPPTKKVSVAENSKTIQFNSESNLSSRKRKKPHVEDEGNLLGQNDVSHKNPSKKLSLVSTGKESDVKNNDLIKDFAPNQQTVVQDSGTLQVKSGRQGSSRRIKNAKFNMYSVLKKCPKCGNRVRGKLSRHTNFCVEKEEQDITQQSSKALETCQNILPLSSKSQNGKTMGIDIKNPKSENKGDRCGVNEAMADNGCEVKNINIAKEIIPERTVRSATESFKLNYICKEVSSKLYLKDNPYCTLCGKAFIFRSAFEAHKQLHENAGWYLCYKCGITYRNEKNLIRHCQVTHSGEYVFEFEQEKSVPDGKTKGSISDSFSSKLIKKNLHKQKLGESQAGFHDKLGHFECRQCRRIFRYKNQLKLHMERRYKVCWDKELIKIHCSLCNLKFKNRMKLKSHWKCHRNSKLFTCIVCGKAFNLQNEFLYHKCVNFKRRKCSPKKKVIPEKQNVTVDAVGVKVDEENASIVKLEGGLSSQTKVTKKNKLYKCPKNKLYKCPACRRKFDNRENFAAHVVKHEKTKWYICVDCSLCFWLKEGLKEHSMYAHSEHWAAEENSPKEATSTKDKENLLKEATSNQVKGNSPNEATSTKVKENLPKEALRTLVKSEVIEFICSVCGEQCPCSETFKQHVLQHENENWCICGECGNCYRDRANLLVHEKKYHDKMAVNISTSEEKKDHDKMPDDISTSEEKKYDEMPDSISTSEESKNSLGENKTLRVSVERMSPCNICGVYYGTSETELQKHLTAHKMQKQRKLFKCSLCKKTFENRKLLLSHKAVHSFKKQSSSNGLKERNMNSKNSSSFRQRNARLCRSVYRKGCAVSKSIVEPVNSRKSLFLKNLLLERVVKQPNLMFNHKKITRLSAKKFVCVCCNSKFFFKGSLDNHVKKFHKLDVISEKVSKNNSSIVPD